MQNYSNHLARRLVKFASLFLVGMVLSQILGIIVIYQTISDPQAASMVVQAVVQNLAAIIVVSAFIVLSLANLFVKRFITSYKGIRAPALTLLIATALPSYLLIPRMDFLQEAALADGYPVAHSPLAQYFETLQILLFMMILIQACSAILMAWRQLTMDV